MRLTFTTRVFAIVAALALSACPGPGDPTPAMPMELGMRASDGSFVPLLDGDTMPVLLGANGLNMVLPSLRATGINPAAPDPSVEVEVGGIVMAADIEGARVDMEDDGTGFVLWNLQTPFQTQLCCYVCGEATLVARIRDHSGNRFEGRVAVRLERGGCPDPDACCASADMCPDPTLATVCP